MKALLAAVCLASASPAHSRLTILWVPAADFASWSELDRALTHYDDLRLTVAVSSDAHPDAQKRSLVNEGRLEVALRLDSDPLLPLIASRPKARVPMTRPLLPGTRARTVPRGLRLGACRFRLALVLFRRLRDSSDGFVLGRRRRTRSTASWANTETS